MGKSRKSKELWIYGPGLDLIVGCGAWSAPLLLIAYFGAASNVRLWAVVFYALALFCNYPHYMATIYRAYHRAEDFEKYRVFTIHITALVLLTLLASHFWLRLLPWIFTIYLTWSPWHYSGQNYGLFMMFARRAGADPTPETRRALYWAFIVSCVALLLGFHTGPSSDPLFISLGIPSAMGRAAQIVAGIAFVVLSSFGFSKLLPSTGWRKLIPSLTLFSTQFLWFLLPAAISLVKGLAILQSRYSTGVLAVMHSAQYLWITSYYARREAASANATVPDSTRRAGNWRPLAYFAVLVGGGVALFVPGPWLASRAFHSDFTASFLIFTALVNIHHFILDGAIWKLRDGRIAALLLNSRERVAGSVTTVQTRVAAAWQWFAAGSPAVRRVQIGLAVFLFTLASLDQARHYLALRNDNLGDLERAAALNSFDEPLQIRLAQTETKAGNAQKAEISWRRAIQLNPTDPAPRQGLLRLLIDQKRLQEAFTLTETSLAYTPRDPNLLVDRGLLALQRGQADVALTSWNQALAADSNQPLAHLYLGDELDREGKPQAAAGHYRSFLESVARRQPGARPSPDLVIGVVLRMADCEARSSQAEAAIKSYSMAASLAAETNRPRFESVAEMNEAELEARSGRMDDALALYQRALRLDDSIADNAAGGLDWFNYGRFLEESGFPARLAYACIVKSESATRALSHSRLPQEVDSRRELLKDRLERELGGAAAAAIRRDPGPLSQEALLLRR